MASNGSVDPVQNGVFNDRRGTNPFAPVDSRHSRVVQHQTFKTSENDFSYNGRGTRNPNGALPPSTFNGRTFPREDPDVAGRRKALARLGEKGSK